MKIICKVSTEVNKGDFDEYKLVVELSNKFFEVYVRVGGYGNDKHINIISSGVTLQANLLKVSCSGVDVSTLLLHVQLCTFIMEQYPELRQITFDSRGKAVYNVGLQDSSAGSFIDRK